MTETEPTLVDRHARFGDDQRLEIGAAALLGLATVVIAWAAYQANLWGGLQDKALTESANLTTQAIGAYSEADALVSLDQALFVEIVLQLNTEGSEDSALDAVDFLLANMTLEGETAVVDWFENDLDLPFTEDYYAAFYSFGDDLFAQAEAKFEEGSQNNTNGDKYVLVSTILASVLFFAGISTVLRGDRVRQVLLAAAAVLWLGSLISLFTLPVTGL